MIYQKSPQIITLITVAAFLTGILAYYQIFLSIILYLPIAFYPFFRKINHLTPIHIGYCTFSMYLMGIIDAFAIASMSPFSLFIIMTTIRYYGQFQLNNCYHHLELKWSSFTIYHSRQYAIAFAFMLLQHYITGHIFEFQYKNYHFLMIPSFIICLIGLYLRVMAFFTAKKNFTHLVSYNKKKQHVLVTHGVYKYFRHPSYTGFFYLQVFGMVLIGNFVSAVLYSLALTKFFRERLEVEEWNLFIFFPNEYKEYYKRTYTFIPFLVQYTDKEIPN